MGSKRLDPHAQNGLGESRGSELPVEANAAGVAAIVLAAGASRRLGEPKQLVWLGAERLLERAVRVATEAGLTPVVVVLGFAAERIGEACNLRGAVVVVNDGWAEGMGSSLRVGVEALLRVWRGPLHEDVVGTHGDTGAVTHAGVVVLTCDMPGVGPAHLRELVRRGMAGGANAKTVASTYTMGDLAGRGVPAFFPGTRMVELLNIGGDAGARTLLAGAELVALAGGEFDIDTPEMLALARRQFE